MTGASVRSTRQREAISTLLETVDDFRSAQELHDELRRRGENIGLTTVYRTLQSMAAAGMVDTLRTDTGESVYRRCSEHHHHHLVCRSCGSTIEVGDHEVEAWAAEVATKHGFSDVSHTIEIFGTCSDCRSLTAQKARIWRSGCQRAAYLGARRPAPAGSVCVARRRSSRRRESCSAASRLPFWTRSWPQACRSFAAQPSRRSSRPSSLSRKWCHAPAWPPDR